MFSPSEPPSCWITCYPINTNVTSRPEIKGKGKSVTDPTRTGSSTGKDWLERQGKTIDCEIGSANCQTGGKGIAALLFGNTCLSAWGEVQQSLLDVVTAVGTAPSDHRCHHLTENTQTPTDHLASLWTHSASPASLQDCIVKAVVEQSLAFLRRVLCEKRWVLTCINGTGKTLFLMWEGLQVSWELTVGTEKTGRWAGIYAERFVSAALLCPAFDLGSKEAMHESHPYSVCPSCACLLQPSWAGYASMRMCSPSAIMSLTMCQKLY